MVRPIKYETKSIHYGVTLPEHIVQGVDEEIKGTDLTRSEYTKIALQQANSKMVHEQAKETRLLKGELKAYKEENINLKNEVIKLRTSMEEILNRQNNYLEGIGTKVESGSIFVKAPEIPEIKEYIQNQKYEISQKVRRFNDKGINPLTHMDGLVDSYYADFIDHEKTKGTIVNEKEMQSIKMSIRRELIDIIGR